MKNREKLCHDPLTKDTLYCLDCKMSTCKKCLSFNIPEVSNNVSKLILPAFLVSCNFGK